ncbi:MULTISPECIES: DUF4390 domain-containing protein [unclassified Polynucleobacter]|jgi:hypothetical protein|uniref:DUF4390 domain-containing protein n=1 Tax=unclassified Polynucleobacter TaxID=2640945 RepID=UPI001D251345|nr:MULTISPECIES: DUF4390 domain-containing protein [unclassified Polynucleobacter]MBU3547509.1 DUF4390 domain-containing protein [Polynucleobacter sp. P1-05-14]MBU3638201.1 DUF4390 domain-containing protein [Polynucleobacter sp. AP-RePozz3-80-G7]MEA9602116.1 DUF4390 domain-containing protein [Polynucleobacter sp. MG-28-Ekke-A2]QWD81615.1 DUF4390 domain-containing protein [Polynucleobacter sp. MWH-S4W17]
MSRRIKQFLFLFLMVLGIFSTTVSAEGIKIKSFELEKVDNDWLLNAAFQIELSPGLEDAVQKGVVLYFQTEFDLMRSRWYWFDEKSVLVQRQTRLSYQPLTQQYRIASEGFTFSAKTMSEALQAVGSIGGWRVIDGTQLDSSKSYTASMRMSLDLSKLPKPFQVNALNNREWNVSSDWYRFLFSPNGPNLIKR